MQKNDFDVSIIIVNGNTKQLLLDCIASVYGTVKHFSFEITVVDNGSTDGSVEAVAHAYPDVKVIVYRSNFGFAEANNLAMKQIRGRYAVILKSDTRLNESAMDDLVDFMERHPEAGMCGPQLLNRDGSSQLSIGAFPNIWNEFVNSGIVRIISPEKRQNLLNCRSESIKEPVEVDFMLGACMVVRRATIESVGILDDDFFSQYEEIDWCYRMRRSGWSVWFIPEARIFHLNRQNLKEINSRAHVELWHSRYCFFKKNLNLKTFAWLGLLTLGFLQNTYQFLLFSLLNLVTMFCFKRLRRPWEMFAYLLAWHVRGRPMSMGIPRYTRSDRTR
jgi:GT2 family glycosyltransferase